MVLGRRFSLSVATLLGALAAPVRAQVPPAPPLAADATAAPPAEPATAPPSPPAAGRQTALTDRDPALIKVVDTAPAADCRFLGQASAVLDGSRGLAEIFFDLRKVAAARGASHIHFSDFDDGGKPSEAAQFYACPSVGIAASPSPAEAGASRAPPRASIGLVVEYLPAGSLHTNVSGIPQAADATATYGVSGSLDYFISPYLSIGAVPGVIADLHGEGATTSATELDLQLRARAGWFAKDGLSVSAYGTAGASWIFFPFDVTSSGTVFGGGIAASYAVGHAGFITLEAGHQVGMQTVRRAGVDADASTRFFRLGLGFGSYF
jgi:hypothetical protein